MKKSLIYNALAIMFPMYTIYNFGIHAYMFLRETLSDFYRPILSSIALKIRAFTIGTKLAYYYIIWER